MVGGKLIIRSGPKEIEMGKLRDSADSSHEEFGRMLRRTTEQNLQQTKLDTIIEGIYLAQIKAQERGHEKAN